MNRKHIFLFIFSLFLSHNCISMNTQETISDQEFNNILQCTSYKPQKLTDLQKIFYLFDGLKKFDSLTNIYNQAFLNNNIAMQFSEYYNYTLLHLAASYKNIEPLDFLLMQNKKILNSQDNVFKQTPLHVAITALAQNKCYNKHVLLLINAGAGLNHKDGNGNTPLDLAIINKDFELADLLIIKGGISRHGVVSQGKIKTKEKKKEVSFFERFLNFFENTDLSSMNHSPEMERN